MRHEHKIMRNEELGGAEDDARGRGAQTHLEHEDIRERVDGELLGRLQQTPINRALFLGLF
jgi:hypothetical protein